MKFFKTTKPNVLNWEECTEEEFYKIIKKSTNYIIHRYYKNKKEEARILYVYK